MSKQIKSPPDGYHTLTPYLIVKGAGKAIEFYKKALGADELFRLEMGGGIIGHAELQIGDSRFMLADEHPEMGALGPQSVGGTPVSFMIYVRDVDATATHAVNCGMKVKTPLKDQFYGDRNGTFTDPFGHAWTLSQHKEEVSPEEMKKRMAALPQH